MFDFHQSEKTFWRTMNPARLHALLHARMHGSEQTADGLRADDAKGGSLQAYLRGD